MGQSNILAITDFSNVQIDGLCFINQSRAWAFYFKLSKSGNSFSISDFTTRNDVSNNNNSSLSCVVSPDGNTLKAYVGNPFVISVRGFLFLFLPSLRYQNSGYVDSDFLGSVVFCGHTTFRFGISSNFHVNYIGFPLNFINSVPQISASDIVVYSDIPTFISYESIISSSLQSGLASIANRISNADNVSLKSSLDSISNCLSQIYDFLFNDLYYVIENLSIPLEDIYDALAGSNNPLSNIEQVFTQFLNYANAVPSYPNSFANSLKNIVTALGNISGGGGSGGGSGSVDLVLPEVNIDIICDSLKDVSKTLIPRINFSDFGD